MFYKFFGSKGSGRPLSSASHSNNEIKQNIELADELSKIIGTEHQKRASLPLMLYCT